MTRLVKNRLPQNKVRIIAGKFKGRQLTFPTATGLRPTGNRIRETLFNWLAPLIVDSHCLDLFSGSGALGVEALSRGASHVTFIEQNPVVHATLKDEFSRINLPAANYTLLNQNVLDTLPHLISTVDIIFLDPPFAGNYWLPCGQLFLSLTLLKPQTVIYTEAPTATIFHEFAALGFHILKEQQAGTITYGLLKSL